MDTLLWGGQIMNDYYMDKARAEQRADRIRMSAQQLPGLQPPLFPKKDETQNYTILYRRILISVIFIVLATVLLLSTNPAQAQQAFEPGNGELFADTMVAFTLGKYYFIKEDYEKAVDYFTEAVESLPVEVYEHDATFANLYLYLGDAQEVAGLHDEALESYALYIEYSGDEVELEDIVLQDVEDSVLALVMVDQ
jgi:tetratricopeptide (TPR) repeat protein